MSDREEEIARCAELLAAECGEVLLVGGQAVGLLTAEFRRRGAPIDTRRLEDLAGAARNTEDIDFAIRSGRLADAARALTEAGFHRTDGGTRFLSDAAIVDLLEANTEPVPGPVDQESHPWAIPAPADQIGVITIKPGGASVRVPTIAALVAMKAQSWASRSSTRPEKKGTDLADIASLALCERVRPTGARECFQEWAPRVKAAVFYNLRHIHTLFASPDADGVTAYVKVVREFAGSPWTPDDDERAAANASDAVRVLLAAYREG